MLKKNEKKKRLEKLPKLTWDNSLPIIGKKDEIIKAIRKNRAIVVSGDTGCGKTTQIPKFCLAAGRGIKGMIGCTQPRRIAATTTAGRIAEELGQDLGQAVGYKIRFSDKTSHESYIKVMTDGILLAETAKDRLLKLYDTIIVDEAHERSINIDFVLGILKILLDKRKDLKVIITSATIDTEKFSNAFNAPIIKVSGRMYPVKTLYAGSDLKSEESAYVDMAVRELHKVVHKDPDGHILIFMPTEQDIRETCDIIKSRNYKGAYVLPLFARLSISDQKKAFSRSSAGARKIIVATNVAETSITIPGIKYVIDTGLARVSRYSPRLRITSLPIAKISQSSANQRKGRCGRVRNGICIRLYSEEDFKSSPLYTSPEILRTNLAEVILKMIALRLGDISDFPFIDKPAPKSVKDGFNLLLELNAVKKRKGIISLTKEGKIMARLPIDPRLSRILIEAGSKGCLQEALIIASAISIQDPRERPAEKTDQADTAHSKFKDPMSDFTTFLNLWKKTKDKKGSELRKICKESFLSFNRMRQWKDVHYQLSSILKEHRIANKKKTPEKEQTKKGVFSEKYTEVHKSILSGFLSNIAIKKEKNLYIGSSGKQLMIFPGSGLFNRAGDWIVCAEMVQTSKLFARTAASISNEWLEEIGKDLCKYTYLDPRWDKDNGRVIATEQTTLYGLIIKSGKIVSYGKIDKNRASEIFLRALVYEEIKDDFSFINFNTNLIREIKDMENRLRKRDLLVSEENIVSNYRAKLSGICDVRALKRLIREKGGDEFLRMKKVDLLNYLPRQKELDLFPNMIDLKAGSFKCKYMFSPDQNRDGLTIQIPWNLTRSVDTNAIDWLVPGLYKKKILELIKGLPAKYRKNLVPIVSAAQTIAQDMPIKETSLAVALSDFIFKKFKVNIPASAWREDKLPDYLKARISIKGPDGTELKSSRDKTILKEKVEVSEPEEIIKLKKEWERLLKKWDFEDLPDIIEHKIPNQDLWRLYPGFNPVDRSTVKLQLFNSKRDDKHIKGTAILIQNHLAKDIKFLKNRLKLPDNLSVRHFRGKESFKEMIYNTVVKRLFYRDIRCREKFFSYLEDVRIQMDKVSMEILNKSLDVLKAFEEAVSILDDLRAKHRFNSTINEFIAKREEELSLIAPENFIEIYRPAKFVHIARYIKATAIRSQRGVINPEKDRARAIYVDKFTKQLETLISSLTPESNKAKQKAVEELFWLIEEYKVSVFAQDLKTAVKVSKKRLDEKITEIKRLV